MGFLCWEGWAIYSGVAAPLRLLPWLRIVVWFICLFNCSLEIKSWPLKWKHNQLSLQEACLGQQWLLHTLSNQPLGLSITIPMFHKVQQPRPKVRSHQMSSFKWWAPMMTSGMREMFFHCTDIFIIMPANFRKMFLKISQNTSRVCSDNTFKTLVDLHHGYDVVDRAGCWVGMTRFSKSYARVCTHQGV